MVKIKAVNILELVHYTTKFVNRPINRQSIYKYIRDIIGLIIGITAVIL